MDKGLKKLFDYQLFSGNKQLTDMLSEAEARNNALLSDEDLTLVSAAGTCDPTQAELIRKLKQKRRL